MRQCSTLSRCPVSGVHFRCLNIVMIEHTAVLQQVGRIRFRQPVRLSTRLTVSNDFNELLQIDDASRRNRVVQLLVKG